MLEFESEFIETGLIDPNFSELAPNDTARRILGKVLMDIQVGGFSIDGGYMTDGVVVIGTNPDDSFRCLARSMRRDEEPYYRLKVIDYLPRSNGLFRSVVLVSDQRVHKEYSDFTQEIDQSYEKSERSPLPEDEKDEFTRQILDAPINNELIQEELEYLRRRNPVLL